MRWSRFNDATFLSILREGETLIVGVDFPIPLIVKINAPTKRPDSRELGSYYFDTAKDNEVISICDVVYQNHRTNHPTWEGAVEIEKSKVGASGDVISSTIIKTYRYE